MKLKVELRSSKTT